MRRRNVIRGAVMAIAGTALKGLGGSASAAASQPNPKTDALNSVSIDPESNGFLLTGDGTDGGSYLCSADGSEQIIDCHRVVLTVERDGGPTVTYYRGTPAQANAAYLGSADENLDVLDAVVVRRPSFVIAGGFVEEG